MVEEAAVLGAGNMGTAVAQVLAANGYPVRLWSIEHDVLEEVRDKHLNTKYLDDVRLHDNITAAWDLAEAVREAKLVVVSVPSQVVRSLARQLKEIVRPGQLVLNVAKGLEADSHLRMSQVICEEFPDDCDPFVGSMGGPAIAIEMARGQPLAVIIAIEDEPGMREVQRMLQNEHLKVEATRDRTGLELCATLKNVYAIALGMCDGIGHGTNYKAFLASVALGEMRRIVTLLGGQAETVYGLAGVGDLLTTGFSPHSRNRTMGEKLAKGGADRFLRTNTVEGVTACREMGELLEGRRIETPLMDTVREVLFGGRPAVEALRSFFASFSYP